MPEWLPMLADLGTPVAVCLIFLWFMSKMAGQFARLLERMAAKHEAELKSIGEACHRHTDELSARCEAVVAENTTVLRASLAQGGELLAFMRRQNGRATP